LGVTNNADGEITTIELDPREPYLRDKKPGYQVVQLQFPPSRILVRIDAADRAGLHMPDLPRGVIACGPLEKDFSVVGRYERTFTIRRKQLPLTAGNLKSVYRVQGETFGKVVLHLKKPVGGALNSRAAVHAALSRATDVGEVYLSSPVSLDDLTNRQDAGVVALMDYLKRLEKTTLAAFLADTSTYRPTVEEPFISPTCRDDPANQQEAEDIAVQLDILQWPGISESDTIPDGGASSSGPTTTDSPDDE
ncbi:unnamed protein product, partial [Laminaria digitata]